MVRLVLTLLALALFPACGWAEGNLRLTITAQGNPHPVVGEMVPVVIRAVYDRKIANEKLEIAPSDSFDWIQTCLLYTSPRQRDKRQSRMPSSA